MDDNQTMWLNIATCEERSIVNGPGDRFVLWVQGCPFRCPGCFNPDYLPFVQRKRIAVDEMAATIRGVSGIEGVTFSGGEPMAQAKGLYHLSRLLKDEGLTVVSYTGYTLEELQSMKNVWVHRFLDCIDLLIDGRFEEERQGSLPWRGSDNQRVHFLTNTYRHLETRVNEPSREVEFIIGKDNFVSTGIFNPEFIERLEEVLKGRVS